MPRLRIDNREVEVPEGSTILEAARAAGIEIPTLCYLEGYPAQTSCFVCVVKVNGQERLMPSCVALAEEGQEVESETEEVHAARRAALELLLGDHLGDCVGPCQSICPAHLEIPALLRLIAAGREAEAGRRAREELVLPATLGRICPAPCEKGCRRAGFDEAVAIRLAHRWAGERGLAEGAGAEPGAAESGRRVAIVGAGPAGLAAAYVLRGAGHGCVLLDRYDQPGGMLRYGVSSLELPTDILNAEIEQVLQRGAEFRPGVRVGSEVSLEELRQEYDAVLVAVGEIEEDEVRELGLEWGGKGVAADAHTLATESPGVFVAGSALSPSRAAVRAVAGGKRAAEAIGHYLTGAELQAERRPWTVHMGRLSLEESARLATEASPAVRVVPAGGEGTGFSEAEARREAGRCLHCDCRGLQECKLRRWAAQYGARATRFGGERRGFAWDTSHPEVIYEPGKCIACGLCLQVAEALEEPLGLSFLGRGFPVRVGTPFRERLSRALQQAGPACAKVCPTGALALRKPDAEA